MISCNAETFSFAMRLNDAYIPNYLLIHYLNEIMLPMNTKSTGQTSDTAYVDVC